MSEKGIIYCMTTSVKGLVKIGKAGINRFDARMKDLERDGYAQVNGLKRKFAIEVDEYDSKEVLLDNIFSKSRVDTSELFAVDIDLVVQVLSAFEGTVIFPEAIAKQDIFKTATDNIELSQIPDGEYFMKEGIKGTKNKTNAKLIVKDGKFILASGAVIANLAKSGLPTGWLKVRNKIKIVNNVTQNDVKCTSPSMAAAIVAGHTKNGWKSWKNLNGEYIDSYRIIN